MKKLAIKLLADWCVLLTTILCIKIQECNGSSLTTTEAAVETTKSITTTVGTTTTEDPGDSQAMLVGLLSGLGFFAGIVTCCCIIWCICCGSLCKDTKSNKVSPANSPTELLDRIERGR
ncbi:uncharacterized protein LOC106167824 [Lingula anatina]|uniref:Uncharacterized protein LOC106158868 n=1 Tax=Lingula anatina TaxID=7574 RepID=A0A1S3IVE4_LINAN|nr:uncharacterized protein LOC106158868 [Lingula anatina]XP_013402160.1 uncharacterized protein LOC106167824 [Lingula anatina]|eukprot:XP_013390433.1 uncharacterized protein LOC106158868 [Lingula anatina]